MISVGVKAQPLRCGACGYDKYHLYQVTGNNGGVPVGSYAVACLEEQCGSVTYLVVERPTVGFVWAKGADGLPAPYDEEVGLPPKE